MPRLAAKIVLLCALTLLVAGCFDLETEIMVLRDGSGFVTVWLRMDTRLASISAALNNSSLENDQRQMLQLLETLFAEQQGVQLVDHVVYSEGQEQVLRYRYMFDDVAALNAFWANSENASLAFAIHQAKADWSRSGDDCDAAYSLNVVFDPRPELRVFSFQRTILADQPPAVQQQIIDEFYQGHLRVRLVLPGENRGADPTFVDTAGYPMWEVPLLDLLHNGLKIRSSSRYRCPAGEVRPLQPGEVYPSPALPMTTGPHAALSEVLRTFGNLGELVQMQIEVQVHRRSEISITYRIDPRVAEPIRNLLLLPFATMPTLAQDWEFSSRQEENGPYIFQIKTKRPIRLDETESPFLFAGLDGDRYVFRMQLPQLSFAGNRPPEIAGRVQVKAHVKMPGKIRTSNATVVHEDTADWILTSRDLQQPVTLEAICDD